MTDMSFEMKERMSCPCGKCHCLICGNEMERSALERLKEENARLRTSLEEIKNWFFSEEAKQVEFDFFKVHGHRPFADQWGNALDKKFRHHVESNEKLHVCYGSFCGVCKQVKGSSE